MCVDGGCVALSVEEDVDADDVEAAAADTLLFECRRLCNEYKVDNEKTVNPKAAHVVNELVIRRPLTPNEDVEQCHFCEPSD